MLLCLSLITIIPPSAALSLFVCIISSNHFPVHKIFPHRLNKLKKQSTTRWHHRHSSGILAAYNTAQGRHRT